MGLFFLYKKKNYKMNEKSKSTQQSMPPVSSTPSTTTTTTTTTTTPIPDELQVFDPSEMFLKPTVNASNPQTSTPATTTDNDNQTNDKKMLTKKSRKKEKLLSTATQVSISQDCHQTLPKESCFNGQKKLVSLKKMLILRNQKLKFIVMMMEIVK